MPRTENVLQQDLDFEKHLKLRSEYRAKWKFVPGRSVRTDAGLFSLYMCDADFDSMSARGCLAWGAYTNSMGFEMIFCRASAEGVAKAVASARPRMNWYPDAAHSHVSSCPVEVMDAGILILELRGQPWTMISGLTNPVARTSDLPDRVSALAYDIHAGTSAPTKALSNTGALHLEHGKSTVFERNGDWEEDVPDQWCCDHGIFVAPFQAIQQPDRAFHVYLAGVAIESVTRLDVFCSSHPG